MNAAAIAIGYFQADIRERQRQAVLDIFSLACEPLRHAGSYDFGTSDLAARVRDAGLVLGRDRDFWHTPPAAALFLHRAWITRKNHALRSHDKSELAA